MAETESRTTTAADLVPSAMPPAMRVTAVGRTETPIGYRTTACLFHERASLTVVWDARQPDTRIVPGCLAGIRWSGRPDCENGEIRIARLVRYDLPVAHENLFASVPHDWVADRELVRRAGLLWEALPRCFRHLFNAVFWEGGRFGRYLTGPSSLNGHHKNRNGNLRHCVEVAEGAMRAAEDCEQVSVPILIIAGLLHDAGKADEYRLDPKRRTFSLSDRGALVGHKHTVLEWIAAARAAHRVIIPEAAYLVLVHALTATRGAPPWIGVPEPASLEANILSAADRLSGQSNLVADATNESAAGGFGRYHRHLRGRPYVAPTIDPE
ncbi:MAG TPA: HD domain-containing protein [Rhodocyclaceae bacterium]|nr:HD domain-containing protein [Rhodocyclaceae bacterium]HNB80387.1 HD domain-containing protein [Rhodocyclaceae bacterium]HNC62800.1 HD domain-containing protein [Rhodocyclaceae bacterium]HNH14729.1 HD domain-containing protein [Rhodocyclaceae bacterium]HNI00580.1 HD domain-containing protein [Rhodocyclaceae bacterium]